MTTIHPAQTFTPSSSARPPTVTTISMAGAPVLLLGSTIAFLTVGNGINDGIVGGVLASWAALALVLAFVGCARIIETVLPRAAQFVLFGAAAVGVGGSGFAMSAIFEQVLRDDHGVDGTASIDAHPFALLALLPWGWFMPLTCIAVGISLWRGLLAPWWHAVLFILGGVLFVIGRPAQIGSVAVATDLVLIAAFGLLAVRAWRGPLGPAATNRS